MNITVVMNYLKEKGLQVNKLDIKKVKDIEFNISLDVVDSITNEATSLNYEVVFECILSDINKEIAALIIRTIQYRLENNTLANGTHKVIVRRQIGADKH